jgi:excisionase family DNA binding protein
MENENTKIGNVNPVLSAKEAANFIGISYWTLLNLIREKKIRHIRAGSRILVRRQALEDWMAECEAESMKGDESH